MACDHIGPAELIEMAEADLRERDVAPAEGMRFRWSENPVDGMWASIVTEIERRGEEWIVTRLDRNREPLPDSETGFRALWSAVCAFSAARIREAIRFTRTPHASSACCWRSRTSRSSTAAATSD